MCQIGGDYDIISLEEVEYNPETMFQFTIGETSYVIGILDLLKMLQSDRLANLLRTLPHQSTQLVN